jgi:hypothetical protein
MTFNLLHYKNAAFPCLAVETSEEDRFLRNVLSIPDAPVYLITAVPGLRDLRNNSIIDASMPFPKAFAYAAKQTGAILIVYDFQHVIKNPGAYRTLKDCFPDLKDKGSIILLVSPSWSLPAELTHDIPVVQFDLPTRAQLSRALKVVADGASVAINNEESLLDAAAGLSLQEAENAFALTLVETKKLEASTVEREKMRLVRSSGFLEVSAAASPDSIGGLGNLKNYIRDEVLHSKGNDLLRVRGVLLVGVPGTGKSLASRAAGAILGWPVLRMDISGLKGSLVGQSESNLKQALKLADAIAPCVLWLDEIEKAVGGYASSAQSDGGTTLGMVGALLTWMQEHTSPVIVLATCNDYSKLPAELTRAGRFDERFFVDLPSQVERAEIASVHLNKYIDKAAGLCFSSAIADITNDWTGAEIEQLIKSAARRSGGVMDKDTLTACAADVRPISKVKADEINKLRDWAKSSLRIANTPEASLSQMAKGRKVQVQ